MGKFENTKEKKKQMKKCVKLGIIAVLVLLLAVMPMLAANRQTADSTQASILSAAVENKDIDTQIIGGGQLTSDASLNIRIPENVKLTQYLVGNGDTVKEGDAVAKVDKVSVMTAITEVQETLDYLADEIADASNDTASTSVKALAGGTVKVIYAREGESVQDVMLDHGALAVLSLDDVMAVKIERESSLDVGDTVIVTLPDGSKVDGRVKTNLEGVLTITMDDDDYSVGAKVTVATEDGDRLGTGELYIFSPWSATAYSGTIDDILVDENDSVYIGQTMFSLEDTGNSAQFQRLIDQRQEYEELMQELFTMYRTETITAPCDGIVTGVDKDGAYLLSDSGEGWFVNLLSFFSGDDEDGFIAYAAQVTEVTEDGMTLRMDPDVTHVEDLTALATASVDISNMTEVWNYSGFDTIYTQNDEGLLQPAGSAKEGDILLAVGDEEQVHWFVVLRGNEESVKTVQTGNKYSGFFAFLLSDSDTSDETNTEGPVDVINNNNIDTGLNNEVSIVTDDLETDGNGEKTGSNNAEGNEHETNNESNGENSTNTSDNNGAVTRTGDNTNSNSGETDGNNGGESGGNNGGETGGNNSGETGGNNSGETGGNNGSESGGNNGGNNGNENDNDDDDPSGVIVRISTTALNQGAVGQSYNSPLQATDGTNVLTGTWAANGLPSGLTIQADTGVISGTPTTAGSSNVTISFTYNETIVTKELTLVIVEASSTVETYLGYVAQVTEVGNGAMKVKQTAYTYTVTDLNNLPVVSVDVNALTQEATYVSSLITESSVAVNDYLLIIVEQDGTLKHFVKQQAPSSGGQTGTPGEGTGGMPSGGSMPSGGTAGGGMTMGGMGQVQTFETYSLDKLTIASVTSQEHMTVSITIDELDITKIYVGQTAVVSVDALGGEQFEAEITKISNSGENEGGNSKFTVEVTLAKSGDMLPGMYSSAFITLDTSESVPSVPVAALNKSGVETILYTSYDADDGILCDPVVVTIGVSDGENVEILSGLSLGQTCYYEYHDTYVGSDAPQQGSFSLGMMMGGR